MKEPTELEHFKYKMISELGSIRKDLSLGKNTNAHKKVAQLLSSLQQLSIPV